MHSSLRDRRLMNLSGQGSRASTPHSSGTRPGSINEPTSAQPFQAQGPSLACDRPTLDKEQGMIVERMNGQRRVPSDQLLTNT